MDRIYRIGLDGIKVKKLRKRCIIHRVEHGQDRIGKQKNAKYKKLIN